MNYNTNFNQKKEGQFTTLCLFILIFFQFKSNAQLPYMVKDINQFEAYIGSDPQNFLKIGSTIYFSAYDIKNYRQLWKTDGTEAGTVRLTSINAEAGMAPQNLIESNGIIYFSNFDKVNGRELWKSDGTDIGTVLLKDIRPGTDSFDDAFSSNPSNLVNVNGTLFFIAQDGINGQELWKSDGTMAGTVLVKNINSGSANSEARNLINVNGILYFTATNGISGEELWKSDGTNSGTILVKDIYPGGTSSYPTNLTGFGNNVYFFAEDAASGYELWKSDGTETGTIIVKDINTGISDSFPTELIEMNGYLYFNAFTNINGDELWRTDGTSIGTTLFLDINKGTSGQKPLSSSPKNLTNINGTLYFGANYTLINSTTITTEIWKCDGTVAGTVLVKKINSSNYTSYIDSYLKNFTANNGQIYFTLGDNVGYGQDLWKTDGTTAGTLPFITGNYIYFNNLISLNNSLFFTYSGPKGKQIYKTDNSQNEASVVKIINRGTIGSTNQIYNIANINSTIFFTADDGISGLELWKSDGTTMGTALLKDISPGFESSNIANLKNVNGKIFFGEYNNTSSSSDFWISDGSVAGTVLVKSNISGQLNSFIDVNGITFFIAEGIYKSTLWKTDGTTAGTLSINDFDEFEGITNLTNVSGVLYFTGRLNDANERGLWKSDGTINGTVLVKVIDSQSLLAFNNSLYFLANTPSSGRGLWKSDGTEIGTVLVKDIAVGQLYPNFPKITSFNGSIYFTAIDNIGYGIWKSDGTTLGTVKVVIINYSGLNYNGPMKYKQSGNQLFFVAATNSIGFELFKTDGTLSGTFLVKDIYPGTGHGNPTELTDVNGVLYFIANNDIKGKELWKTDGNTTVMVKELNYSADTFPAQLINANNNLFFKAETNLANQYYGTEIWKIGNCTKEISSLPSSQLTNYFNSQAQSNPVSSTCFCDEFNNLVSTVNAIGSSPVNGNMSNKVWVDKTQNANYVNRHYELNPTNNPFTATARITLYFTQQEFNEFNALNTTDLPNSPSDENGISNLRIEKRGGFSLYETGKPESYSGSTEILNPTDSDIVWNPIKNLWEITIDVVGFGGFFIKTPALPSITAPNAILAYTNTSCNAINLFLGTPICNNCTIVSSNNNAPLTFPLGITTVIWSVTDNYGNTKTASQTVTVTDNVLPTLTAPANINLTSSVPVTGLNLGTPTTADNCSVATTTNNAPSSFPIGITTVTWTVTDGSGNTKTATQVVTVTNCISMSTNKSGEWSDPTVWSCGRIPVATDPVTINTDHVITVPTGTFPVKNIIYMGGTIELGNGGHIQLNP